MNVLNRVEKLEAATVGERKERRLMELIAEGAQRVRNQPINNLSLLSESELLTIIGTDRSQYDSAVRDFALWWQSEGRVQYGFERP